MPAAQRFSSRIRTTVTMAEMAKDPRQPNRLLKRKNTSDLAAVVAKKNQEDCPAQGSVPNPCADQRALPEWSAS